MRYSKFLIPTLREDPAEAEVVSHKLMVRAGMIRRLALGIYSYLPLGLRSLRKIQNIIREELDKVGALELLIAPGPPGRTLEGIRALGGIRQGTSQVHRSP